MEETNKYILDGKNICINYMPNTHIYINIILINSLRNYETYIKNYELKNNIQLNQFNQIINKCLKNEPNYNIQWIYNSDSLSIKFSAIFDGFFNIEQEIVLKEIILSCEQSITMKIINLETIIEEEVKELNNEIKKQKEEIYNLKNEDIIFAINEKIFPNDKKIFGNFFKVPKLTETLDLRIKIDKSYKWIGNYIDFNKLSNLKTIIIYSNSFGYEKEIIDIYNSSSGYHNYISNNLYASTYYFNKLTNIFDSELIYLPSVLEIEIENKCCFQPPKELRSLENLSKITFINYGIYTLQVNNLIMNIKKLKHIVFKSCLNIESLDTINKYCDEKKIIVEHC